MTKGTLIFVLTFLLMFIRCEGGVQQCRSGFNTSIFNIPISAWNESYRCSSAEEQSCFITELKYSNSIFDNEDLTLNFGSCLPTAYESVLTCDAYLTLDGQALPIILASLQNQGDDIVAGLSEAVAEELYDRINQLDKVEVIGNVLESMNVSVPNYLQNIIRIVERAVQIMQHNSTDISVIIEENDFDLLINFTKDFLISKNVSIMLLDDPALRLVVKSIYQVIVDNETDVADVLQQASLQYIQSMNFTISNGTLEFITSIFDIIGSNETGLWQSILVNGTSGLVDLTNATVEWDMLLQIVDALNENETKILSYLLDAAAEYLDEKNRTVLSNMIDFIQVAINAKDGADFETFINTTVEYLENMNITIPVNAVQYVLEVYQAFKTNESDIFPAIVLPIIRIYGERNNVTIPQDIAAIIDNINNIFKSNTSQISTVAMRLFTMYLDEIGIDLPNETVSFISNVFDKLIDRNNSFSYSEILNGTMNLLQYSNVTIPKETIDLLMRLNNMLGSNDSNISYTNLLNGTLQFLEQFNFTSSTLNLILDLGNDWREGEITLQALIIKATFNILEERTNYTIPDPITDFVVDLIDAMTNNESDIHLILIDITLDRLDEMIPAISEDVVQMLRYVRNSLRNNDTDFVDALQNVLPVLLQRMNVSVSDNTIISIISMVNSIRANDTDILLPLSETVVAVLHDMNITIPDNILEALNSNNSSELISSILSVIFERMDINISETTIASVYKLARAIISNETDVLPILVESAASVLHDMNITIPDRTVQVLKNLTFALMNNGSDVDIHILDAVIIILEYTNVNASLPIVQAIVDIKNTLKNNESNIIDMIPSILQDVLQQASLNISQDTIGSIIKLATAITSNDTNVSTVIVECAADVLLDMNTTLPDEVILSLKNLTFGLLNNESEINLRILDAAIAILEYRNNTMAFVEVLFDIRDSLRNNGSNVSDVLLKAIPIFLDSMNISISENTVVSIFKLANAIASNDTNVLMVLVDSMASVLQDLNTTIPDKIIQSLKNLTLEFIHNGSDMNIQIFDAVIIILEYMDNNLSLPILNAVVDIRDTLKNNESNIIDIIPSILQDVFQQASLNISQETISSIIKLATAITTNDTNVSTVIVECAADVLLDMNTTLPDEVIQSLKNLTFGLLNNESEINLRLLDAAIAILEYRNKTMAFVDVLDVLRDSLRNNGSNVSDVLLEVIPVFLERVNISISENTIVSFIKLANAIANNDTDVLMVLVESTASFLKDFNTTIPDKAIQSLANVTLELLNNSSDMNFRILDIAVILLEYTDNNVSLPILEAVVDVRNSLQNNDSDILLVILNKTIDILQNQTNARIPTYWIDFLTDLALTTKDNETSVPSVFIEHFILVIARRANFTIPPSVVNKTLEFIEEAGGIENIPSVFMNKTQSYWQYLNSTDSMNMTEIIANTLNNSIDFWNSTDVLESIEGFMDQMNGSLPSYVLDLIVELRGNASDSDNDTYSAILNRTATLVQQIENKIPNELVEVVKEFATIIASNDSNSYQLVIKSARVLLRLYNVNVSDEIFDSLMSISNATRMNDSYIYSAIIDTAVLVFQELNLPVAETIAQSVKTVITAMEDGKNNTSSVILDEITSLLQFMNSTVPDPVLQIVMNISSALKDEENDAATYILESIFNVVQQQINVSIPDSVTNLLLDLAFSTRNNDSLSIQSIILQHVIPIVEERFNITIPSPIVQIIKEVVVDIRNNETNIYDKLMNRTASSLQQYLNTSLSMALEDMLPTISKVVAETGINGTDFAHIFSQFLNQTNETTADNLAMLAMYLTTTMNESDIESVILNRVNAIAQAMNVTIDQEVIITLAELIPAIANTNESGLDLIVRKGIKMLFMRVDVNISDEMAYHTVDVIMSVINNQSDISSVVKEAGLYFLQETNYTTGIAVVEFIDTVISAIRDNGTSLPSDVEERLYVIFQLMNASVSNTTIETIIDIGNAFLNDEIDVLPVIFDGVIKVVRQNVNVTFSQAGINLLFNLTESFSNNESCIYCIFIPQFMPVLEDQMNITVPMDIVEMVMKIIDGVRNNQTNISHNVINLSAKLLQHYFNQSIPNEILDMIVNLTSAYNEMNATDWVDALAVLSQHLNGTVPEYITEIMMHLKDIVNNDGTDLVSIITNGTINIAQRMNATIPRELIETAVEILLSARNNESDPDTIFRKSINIINSYGNISVSDEVIDALINVANSVMSNDTDQYVTILDGVETILQEMNFTTESKIVQSSRIVLSAILANESDVGSVILNELTNLLHFAGETAENSTIIEILTNITDFVKSNETISSALLRDSVARVISQYTNITISNSVVNLLFDICKAVTTNNSDISYVILQHSVQILEDYMNVTIPDSAVQIILKLRTAINSEGLNISHNVLNTSAIILQELFNITLSPKFVGALQNFSDNMIMNESDIMDFLKIVSVLLQEMNETIPEPISKLAMYLSDGILNRNQTDIFSMVVNGTVSILHQMNITIPQDVIQVVEDIFVWYRKNDSDINQVIENVLHVLLSHSNLNMTDEMINSLINVSMSIRSNESEIYIGILEGAAALLKEMNRTFAEEVTRSVLRVIIAFNSNQSDIGHVILDEISNVIQFVNVSKENEALLTALMDIADSLMSNDSDTVSVILDIAFEIVQQQCNITISSSYTDALIELVSVVRANDSSVYSLIVQYSVMLIEENMNITIPSAAEHIALGIICQFSACDNSSYEFMNGSATSALLEIVKLLVLENSDIGFWNNFTDIGNGSFNMIMIMNQFNNSVPDELLQLLVLLGDSGGFNSSTLIQRTVALLQYMNVSVPDPLFDFILDISDVIKHNESEMYSKIHQILLKTFIRRMNLTMDVIPRELIQDIMEFFEAIDNPDINASHQLCNTTLHALRHSANVTLSSEEINMTCSFVHAVVTNATNASEIRSNLIAVIQEMLSFNNDTDLYQFFLNVTSQYLQENNITKPGDIFDLVQLLTNAMQSNMSDNFESQISRLAEYLQATSNSTLSRALRFAVRLIFGSNGNVSESSSAIWNVTRNYLDKIGFPVEIIELIWEIRQESSVNGTNVYYNVLNATVRYLDDVNTTVSIYAARVLRAMISNQTDLRPVLEDIAIAYLESLNFTTGQIPLNLSSLIDNILTNNSNPALTLIYDEIIKSLSNTNTSISTNTSIDEIFEFINNIATNAINSSGITYLDIVLGVVEVLEESNVTLPDDFLIAIKVLVKINNVTSQNNTSIMDGILSIVMAMIEDKYCVSTNVTKAYAEALYNDAMEKGVVVDPKYQRYLECVPGYFLATYPNNTDIIEDTVTLITLYYNNITQFIEVMFGRNNMTVPTEIVRLVRLLEDLDAAGGNRSDVLSILTAYFDQSAQPTELSQLVMTILTRNDINATEYQTLIEYVCLQFYSVLPGNVTTNAERIFEFLNDISSGVDLGPAILNVLNSTMMDVPDEVVYILLHIQPVIDSVMSNETDFINEMQIFVIGYLEMYPKPYLELYIEVVRLYSISQEANMTLHDPAVQDIVKEIFALSLVIANTTTKDIVETLNDRFPTLAILRALKDDEMVAVGLDLIAWYFDSERNISTLVPIVEDIIHITFARQNISLYDIIVHGLTPTSCKHEYCSVNMCNVPELMDNTTAVTVPPESTTTAITVPPESTTTTVTVPPESTTTAITVPPESTTTTVTVNPESATTTTVTVPPESTTIASSTQSLMETSLPPTDSIVTDRPTSPPTIVATSSTTTSSGRSNVFGHSWFTIYICTALYVLISKTT